MTTIYTSDGTPIAEYVPPPLTASERLLTVREASHRLSLPAQTIYDAIKRGDIEARHYGRRVLIPSAALATFGQARTVRASPVPLRQQEPDVRRTGKRPYVRHG